MGPSHASPRKKSSRKERADITPTKGCVATKKTHTAKKNRKVKSMRSLKTNLISKLDDQVLEKNFIFNNSHVLLTGDIFTNGTPESLVGYHFRYKVGDYSQATKRFELKYECQTIKEDGHYFEVDEDATHEKLFNVKFETVQKGIELFQDAMTRINVRAKEQQNVVRKSLQPNLSECMNASEVDLSDINASAMRDSKKGWMSEEVMKVRINISPRIILITLVNSNIFFF